MGTTICKADEIKFGKPKRDVLYQDEQVVARISELDSLSDGSYGED